MHATPVSYPFLKIALLVLTPGFGSNCLDVVDLLHEDRFAVDVQVAVRVDTSPHGVAGDPEDVSFKVRHPGDTWKNCSVESC